MVYEGRMCNSIPFHRCGSRTEEPEVSRLSGSQSRPKPSWVLGEIQRPISTESNCPPLDRPPPPPPPFTPQTPSVAYFVPSRISPWMKVNRCSPTGSSSAATLASAPRLHQPFIPTTTPPSPITIQTINPHPMTTPTLPSLHINSLGCFYGRRTLRVS